MTDTHTHPHTVKDEWLAARSAGTLSESKQLILDCQAEISPAVREIFISGDRVAGALLETAPGVDVSDQFAARLADKMAAGPVAEKPTSLTHAYPDWLPKQLARFMERLQIPLKWRFAGPGVQRVDLMRAPSGERLYLLRARAGFSVPEHSHSGEEWTLLLSGGYHVGQTGYVAGDLHQEDETCAHAVQIDNDGPCISLVMDEGRLRFANPLVKLMQPFFGL